ncbi:MAG: PTS sugar transporter subunit IIA [Parachlamydiaceae bacterium]|nr:PTS sugar transporter subunit IIA [Parachlamydiaceae bacterium]
MDLKVKDVADLLNVSEGTIYQWLADGKIPAYRLNQHYCFSRGEIQNWVINNKEDHSISQFLGESPSIELSASDLEVSAPCGGIKQFSLFRALHKGRVLLSVNGNTKEEIIRNAMDEIAPSLDLDSEMLFDLLWDRERLQPTALNKGIGVPHTRDFLLKSQDAVFVVFPKTPVDYGALDGQAVHTLFFLFACEDKQHLHLLAKIALFCSQPTTLDLLQQHPSKEALLEYVKGWEGAISKR